MENREVCIQNGKQDNDEEEEEEMMAIEIDIQMRFPIRPAPNGSAAPGEYGPAERFCRLFAPIP
jgi:hypothetical protein